MSRAPFAAWVRPVFATRLFYGDWAQEVLDVARMVVEKLLLPAGSARDMQTFPLDSFLLPEDHWMISAPCYSWWRVYCFASSFCSLF